MVRKISKSDYHKIKKTILRKLYSAGAFSRGHLLLETLQSGIPAHLIGFVPKILNDLIKKKLVKIYGKTKRGTAYQLNNKKLREIEGEIGIK